MLNPMLPIAMFLQEEGGVPAPDGAAPAGGAEGTEEATRSFFDPNCLVPALAVMAIFYFLLIRPERKKAKERESMLGAMQKGDKVMTSSGMFGTVARIQEDEVTLQVADNVRLKFSRAAIQQILERGGKPLGEAKDDGKSAKDDLDE